MGVEISSIDGVTVAALDGRLDSASVDQIDLRFTAGIVPLGKPTIVDLTNVTFMASLGVRLLLSTARGLAGRGAKLALFGANEAVMDVIETTALSDIIPVRDTQAEALAAVTA